MLELGSRETGFGVYAWLAVHLVGARFLSAYMPHAARRVSAS